MSSRRTGGSALIECSTPRSSNRTAVTIGSKELSKELVSKRSRGSKEPTTGSKEPSGGGSDPSDRPLAEFTPINSYFKFQFHGLRRSENSISAKDSLDAIQRQRRRDQEEWIRVVSDVRHYSVVVDHDIDTRFLLSRHFALCVLALVTFCVGMEMLGFETYSFAMVRLKLLTTSTEYWSGHTSFPTTENRNAQTADPFKFGFKFTVVAMVVAHANFLNFTTLNEDLANTRSKGWRCYTQYMTNFTQIPKPLSMLSGHHGGPPHMIDRRTFIERAVAVPINNEAATDRTTCAPTVIVFDYDLLYPKFLKTDVLPVSDFADDLVQIGTRTEKEMENFENDRSILAYPKNR